MRRESLIALPKTQSAFHLHVQRTAFRSRARPQSRLFVLQGRELRPSPRFICLTKYQSRRRKSSNCASSNCFEAFGCSFVTAGEDFSFAASVSARRLSGLGSINTVSQGYRVFFINPFICLIRPAQHRVYSRASVIPFSGTRRVPHPVVLVRPGLQSVMSVSATRDVLQRLKVPNFDT